MRLASVLSRLFLILAIMAAAVAAVSLVAAVVDLITSAGFAPGGLMFSTEMVASDSGGLHGNLNDLGLPAFAVDLIGFVLTGGGAYSLWKISHGFDKVADQRALAADVGADFIRGGLAMVGVMTTMTFLRALWLLTLPREVLGGSRLFWAVGEEVDVGWVVVALVFIVMGRIIREAADLAAEHELTV